MMHRRSPRISFARKISLCPSSGVERGTGVDERNLVDRLEGYGSANTVKPFFVQTHVQSFLHEMRLALHMLVVQGGGCGTALMRPAI
ncbi:MAG TPA: hypothetical protein DCP91_00680 [Eggerthellaceae bacterium]|nr:hypothetical protein [Eggerthellaceae bacterium]